ncbi:hypothetical protein [Bradyrhizobium sp. CCGUVB23]|nr:hypothetical protein [Bradyrhizobium sp. CCGUVB23]
MPDFSPMRTATPSTALHPTAAEELVTMRTPTARHVRQAAE